MLGRNLLSRLALFILSFFISCGVSAQFRLPGNISINSGTHDFGIIKKGSTKSTDFILTNNSKLNLYIYRNVVPEDFSLDFSSQMIAPGQSATLHLEVSRLKLGYFHEIVNVFTSATGEAFPIHITGTVVPVDSIQKDPKDTVVEPGELSLNIYKPNNIVFLLDVSESMMRSDRLPLVKIAMKNLLNSLRSIDRVSIITYASGVTVLLPSTPADQKDAIAAKIDALRARGNTEGGKGIRAAYKVAREHFIPGGNNEIVIATDGDFDLDKSNEVLYKFIRHNADEGIIISVVGVGNIARAIAQMQTIAEKGSGSYIHIKTREDAANVLLDEIMKQSKK